MRLLFSLLRRAPSSRLQRTDGVPSAKIRWARLRTIVKFAVKIRGLRFTWKGLDGLALLLIEENLLEKTAAAVHVFVRLA